MLFIAHRGASDYEPENTLLAFRTGFAMGANAIEFDIRATKDGHLVVIHDPKVNRTTNGHGRVNHLTLKEIQALDAGKGQHLSTLQEVLRQMAGVGTLLTEFKEEGFEKKAARILDGRKGIIAISFDPLILDRLKQIQPNLATGLLLSKRIRTKHQEDFFAFCKKLKVRWLLLESRILSKDLIHAAHRHGFKVIGWVVNRKRRMRKLIEWGIDGIESNKPDLFNYFLDSEKK
jgi:glycerophosphoryl diester phosphodiesterase